MKAVSAGRSGRRGFRKALLLGSALLFPVTMLYFSPGIVFRGARLGILSGSYLTFAALFLGALVFGRAWCGFLCPGGGFCEMARAVNDEPFRRGGLKAVKYVVWVLWLAGIALVAVFVGHGFRTIDPFLGTERGVSLHSLELMPFYYLVIGIILALSLALGRRGFCHTLCWMAPFMVLGRGLRNAMRTPALQLAIRSGGCSYCGACGEACPMSLPVPELVRSGSLEHHDCILCGECVQACPEGRIWLEFGRPPAGEVSPES
jgi:polyferredoxin